MHAHAITLFVENQRHQKKNGRHVDFETVLQRKHNQKKNNYGK